MRESLERRLPGGNFYERRKKLGNSEFLIKYHKFFNEVYFKGLKNVRTEKYIMKEDYFEFAGLKFPAAKEENDFKTLMVEAADIIFPYMFGNGDFNYSKIEKYFDEGPYEISKNVSLEKRDVVIDCGANMGLFSNIALSKQCEVYAFEPSKSMQIRYLSKYKNSAFHIEDYALSDKENEIELVETLTNVGGSHINNVENIGGGLGKYRITSEGNIKKYKVHATTLDNWVLENNIDKVDFIKADIEGAERLMLRGAVNTLCTFSPKLSICTYHFDDDPVVLENIIQQANPNYVVEHKYKKLYAYVPQRNINIRKSWL